MGEDVDDTDILGAGECVVEQDGDGAGDLDVEGLEEAAALGEMSGVLLTEYEELAEYERPGVELDDGNGVKDSQLLDDGRGVQLSDGAAHGVGDSDEVEDGVGDEVTDALKVADSLGADVNEAVIGWDFEG